MNIDNSEWDDGTFTTDHCVQKFTMKIKIVRWCFPRIG